MKRALKMHLISGNDLKTFLLHRTAFLCVSRFLRLASFGTVNALMKVISVTFQPLFSVIPEIFSNFALGEVLGHGGLDARTRLMCILASNVASQGRAAFRATLDAALGAGVTPVEVKEVLYQAVPYVGMAKVADFIGAANDVLEARGVGLPLEGQSTTTPADRFEKGLAVQRSIFGAGHIDAMREAAPENQKHIQQYLSDNCFGDFLTRGGLDVKTRELVTFSLLVSLGGCEPQVKGHIAGNVNLGNDKAVLLAVVTQLLPYIGYPRTLNAIGCLNEVLPE